jgi:hypothetical protein
MWPQGSQKVSSSVEGCVAERRRRPKTIADYMTTVPVTAYGPGLVKAVVDQTSDFYVDTMGLRGSLKVQVDGQSSESLT